MEMCREKDSMEQNLPRESTFDTSKRKEKKCFVLFERSPQKAHTHNSQQTRQSDFTILFDELITVSTDIRTPHLSAKEIKIIIVILILNVYSNRHKIILLLSIYISNHLTLMNPFWMSYICNLTPIHCIDT